MTRYSIIIPSRNELFLQKTIDNIIANAHDDYEIIAYLDGYWPQPALKDHPRLNVIHDSEVRGMRHAIEACASIARGKYLCKLDAHCIVGPEFNRILADSLEPNWIAIPRRYSLDGETFQVENNGKIRDAHYLSYPTAYSDDTYLGFGIHVKDWYERGDKRKDTLIDDEMISQGSCWFMEKDYFWKLGGLPEEGYGQFIQEAQQLMLRCWLTGGRVVCNKNTWYAHLWKGKKWGRMYELSRAESKKGEIYSADYWYNNRWPGRVHGFDWLIDKFWPIPTWPENWKNLNIDFPRVEYSIPEKISSVKTIITYPEKTEMEKPMILDHEINTAVDTLFSNVIAGKHTEIDPNDFRHSPYKRTRNETVDYILKKFNIKDLKKLPIEINYNRCEWGNLFRELGYKRGAEIGVFAGAHSEALCKNNPGVEHYCIDPWEVYIDYVNHRNTKTLEGAEKEAHDRLEKYGCKFIKKYSMDTIKDFEDNSLDYVYIDGNHDAQHVINDIVEWEKKVRPGGIVSGHDYDKHKFHSRCHVMQMVNGYTEATGIYPWFITSKECRRKDYESDGNWMTSWMWVKA